MTDANTILELQVEIGNLIKDLDSRVMKVYDKYTIDKNIPKLPPFNALKSDEVRYNCLKVLTDCVDELNDLKLRISLLQRNLLRYQNFQPASKTDYMVVSKFRETMKLHLENLDTYRFDISDLIRNANAKIKTLEAAQYYEFT